MKKIIPDLVLIASAVFLSAVITTIIVTGHHDKLHKDTDKKEVFTNVCYDNHKKLIDVINDTPEYNDSNDTYYQAINASEYVNDMCYIQTNNTDIHQFDKYIEEYEKTFDLLSAING